MFNHQMALATETEHKNDDFVIALAFKPEKAKPVYQALAKHQVTEDSWDLHDQLAWLQIWSKRFNDAFLLDVNEISLCVDWLPVRRYGHFRAGYNGFGLAGEIAINGRYLAKREPWEILGTLLHELLHAWQQVYGKPGKGNYHNVEFRQKARDFGLIIDTKGHTQYQPESMFVALLDKFGVDRPEVPPVDYVLRGNSKLKKWSCGCDPPINVRVAVPHFYARCLWCGKLSEHSH